MWVAIKAGITGCHIRNLAAGSTDGYVKVATSAGGGALCHVTTLKLRNCMISCTMRANYSVMNTRLKHENKTLAIYRLFFGSRVALLRELHVLVGGGVECESDGHPQDGSSQQSHASIGVLIGLSGAPGSKVDVVCCVRMWARVWMSSGVLFWSRLLLWVIDIFSA